MKRLTWMIGLTLLATTSCTYDKKTEVTQAVAEEMESKSYEGLEGLSIEFLDRLKAEKSTDDILDRYASLSFEEIEAELDNDDKKKAFWLNTYNGFVQDILLKHPERYDNREEFFQREQVNIAGVEMSFDEIEHGVIRSSKWKLGAGYLPKISPEHVRKMRVDSTDGRIHFALNCGAKSCPEIAIYHADKVDEELDIIAKRYLKKTTEIKEETAVVTPLMSWFRGDFNGKSGIKEDYLTHYGLIDENEDIALEFGDYDWTLDLGNYTEI